MRDLWILAVLLVWGMPLPALAQSTLPENVAAILAKHCVACHGPESQKAKLRLDTLTVDFRGSARDVWAAVHQRVHAGEMPPKERPQPSDKEIETLLTWVRTNLERVDAEKRAQEGRVVLRRLNRQEYQNTVRDLFGVDVHVKDMLPEDSSKHGFDNVGSALSVSSILLERYMEAADLVLDAILTQEKKPDATKKTYNYKNESRMLENTRLFRPLEDGVALFSSTYSPSILLNFRAPAKGEYRFSIAASAYQSNDPVIYRALIGEPFGITGRKYVAGYFDASPKGNVSHFTAKLERGDTLNVVPYNTGEGIHQIGAEKFAGRGLKVGDIEIEGPLGEVWPSVGQRRLYGSVPLKMVPHKVPKSRNIREIYEPDPKDPHVDAEKVLRAFLPRAFRRPVNEAEAQPYVKLVHKRLDAGYSFAEALRVGLKAALCSPHFLFFREAPGTLDDYALASRLSYFLWSSMPDEELSTLAARNALRNPDVLRAQTERLFKDPRAHALTENFLGQWLDLRKIQFTTPDRRLYPEFDELLELSSVKETHLFFEELLSNDLSIHNLIDSEFGMLNERLAVHYGVGGVRGQEFRKVKLPPDSERGGVLTHASVLRVTANGTNTSPVTRGVWLLDRILGQPVPPPPPGVPAVEPDIRGAATMRQQLAKHRSTDTCASCHRKIDPPGFALESFDVIGGKREHYRALQGKRGTTEVLGRKIQFGVGLKVDAGDVLADGRSFANFTEFKKLLHADKRTFARCLSEKLTIYATGAGLDFQDYAALDAMIGRWKDNDIGLRSLLHEIVASEMFRRK